MSIEAIVENAEAGRGLWIGMPISQVPSEFEDLFEDPHLTLVHLGKKNDALRVNGARLAVESALKKLGVEQTAFRLQMTGLAFLYRYNSQPTPVMLVNSSDVCRIHHTILDELRDYNVEVSNHFGFIPHVTLKLREDYNPGTTFTRLIAQRSFPVFSWGVEMYCGDARALPISLKGPF